jgi:hypothetical protein
VNTIFEVFFDARIIAVGRAPGHAKYTIPNGLASVDKIGPLTVGIPE